MLKAMMHEFFHLVHPQDWLLPTVSAYVFDVLHSTPPVAFQNKQYSMLK